MFEGFGCDIPEDATTAKNHIRCAIPLCRGGHGIAQNNETVSGSSLPVGGEKKRDVSGNPSKRVGKQTILFPQSPNLTSTATVAGPKEGQGPFGQFFDAVKEDTLLGEKSWEGAERKIVEEAVQLALKKAGLGPTEVDCLLAGDLLNQIISSSYAARELSIPFLGLYGACATLSEALILAAILVDSGYAHYAVAVASSHHDTAERQYRYPTEFANQRPPTAQWTVTGAGAALVGKSPNFPRITHATIGKVIDMGVSDPNDMGGAMAAAASDTIWQHLQDTERSPRDYDLILTGDLGEVGSASALRLLRQAGVDISAVHQDCGLLIFDRARQNVQAGGSGCACSGLVFCGPVYQRLLSGELRRVLLVATGSLHSPCSVQQGQSIPGIAHAVAIEGVSREED
ncbi:MAG TPA: stage V sporulation protein AD [Clostridia bacterium]|nr:stage V sporulation protein AD [Clostridia bacterium]